MLSYRQALRYGRGRRGGQKGKGTIGVSVMLDPSPYELAKRYDFLRDKLLDFRPVWEKMIPKLRRHMGRVWMSQGAAAGTRWPKWKDSYARRRPNGAIGVLTGKLLNQLVTKGALSRTKTSLRFGARGPGVRAFHFGGVATAHLTGKSGQGQAARPYVVATPAVMAMAAEEWNGYISEVLRKWPIKAKGRSAANAMIRRKAA